MSERVIREAEGPGRANVRAALRDPRKRPEWTGGREPTGEIKKHSSAFTKSPLTHRKRRRRAARKATR